MADIASLTFTVDSNPVRRAGDDLRRLGVEGRRAEQETRQSNERMSRSFGSLRSQIGLVAGAIAALGVTREVRTAVSTFASFEQAMARTQAVSRSTAAEFEAMNRIARELGATTEFSASQAASGLEFLSLAGFKASESIAALPGILDLATAATMDLGRAADIASNIMSAFGMEAARAAEVADVLAAVNARANTSVEQLGDAMSYVGPVASALGISINTTAAAVGILSDAGIQGSSAGTGLRRVLSSLVNPTSQARSAIESLGISLEDVNPNVHELEDIIATLATTGIDASTALQIFGDRGGPAILALVENNANLQTLVETMRDVEGESSSMANTMRDTLHGEFKSLEAASEGLRIALVSTFTPQLREGVRGLASGLSAVTQALEAGDYDTHLRVIADIASSAGAAAAAYIGLRGALAAATAAQTLFNTAARANPYIILATTLAALAPLVHRYTQRVKESTQANRDWFESFNLMPGVVASTGQAAGLTAEDIEALTRSTIRDFEARQDSVSSLRDFSVAMLDSQKSVQAVIEALDREYLLLTMTARQRMAYQAIEEAGIGITLRDAVAIREKVDAIFDLREAQEEAERTAREAARGASTLRDSWSSLADQADQTGTAVNNMLENIQREWANTFYSMDFTAKGFFGSVTDGFRRMLSEMASADLMNAVFKGQGMAALTGGNLAGLAKFAGMVAGRDTGVSGAADWSTGVPVEPGQGLATGVRAGLQTAGAAAAGHYAGRFVGESIFGKQAESAIGSAIGTAIGTYLGGPLGASIGAAIGSMVDVATGGDGRVRRNVGMFVGHTPGADPSRTFAVDPFASGLNVTGFARRAEQDQAREVIDIFREIDAGLSMLVGELGGTLDLSRATLAGLDEEARTGSQGTFLGLGGLNELAGDLEYQVQFFFDQLVDHIGGLDDDLLSAVRAADSVESAFEVMTQAMADNVEIQERVSGVLGRVDAEMERVFRELGATAMQPLDLFMESLSQIEHSAAVARVHELVDSMFGLDAALVEAVLSTNDLAEIANILGDEMERVARVAQNVDFGPMVSDLNRAIAAEVGALESELEALIAAEQSRLDQMQAAYDAQAAHWQDVARIEQERAQWSQEAARSALQAEQEIHRQRVDSIRSQQSLLRDRARETQGILSQLERALDQFGFGRDEEFSASRAQAMQTLRGMIGGRIDAEALSGALGVATQDSSRLYSTFVDFARDQGVTANLIAQLSEQTEEQLSAEERQIAALDRAQEIAEKNYEALRREHEEAMEQAKADAAAAASWAQYEMEVERAQFEEAKKQAEERIADARKQHAAQVAELERQRNMALQEIEIQEGTYRAVISVREALENIYSAMTPASNDPVFDQLDDEGFARGGIASGPSTGYSATLHGTEAIVPLPDGRSIPAVVTSDANTAAALNDIISELRGVLEATRATAVHSSKTARTIERWEFDGMPEERDVI